MNTKPPQTAHVELALSKPEHENPTGTVTLLEEGEIILIPTPSPDPRGRSSYIHLCASLVDIVRSTQPSHFPEVGYRYRSWNV